MTNCRFRIERDQVYRCHRPAEHDGFCIFHVFLELERDTTIEQEFHDRLADYVKELRAGDKDEWDFRGFVFPRISMQKEIFSKKLDLRDALFRNKAYFQNADFVEGASFYKGTFYGTADFYGATFNSRADFSWVIFDGLANFAKTTFSNRTSFKHATFGPKASAAFNGAYFDGRTSFWAAKFEGDVNFSWCRINRKVSFMGSETNKIFKSKCDFRYLALDKGALTYFENANLQNATFLDTDLEKVVLRDVHWYKIARFRPGAHGRNALYDEFNPPQKTELYYEKIAENYRQLVLNYERKRDYDMAEDFHVGEMEMRRKKKLKLKWMNGFAVYRILSSYGTSYLQGVAVLALMILFFSGGFVYSGFRPIGGSTKFEARVIEYDFQPDSTHKNVSFSKWAFDFGHAILFTLSTIPLQRERYYEPVGGWSQLWVFVTVLCVTSQAALVLLAIRRRFRR